MASSTPLLFLLLSLLLLTAVASIPEPELESSLTALRSNSYNLFGNAITTSDLRYEVLSGTSFTLFAPLDRALFSLDMTAPASVYVSTLRYHVVPRRLSLSDLHSLPRSSLPTMLPMHHLTVASTNGSARSGANLTVNGVGVVVPGLYYGTNIAVHGLDGILDHRSVKSTSDSPEIPPRFGVGGLSPASGPAMAGSPSEIRASWSMTPKFQPLVVNHPNSAAAETPVPQSPRWSSPVPQSAVTSGIPSGSPSTPPSSYSPHSSVQLQMARDPRMNFPATPHPAPASTPLKSTAFSPDFVLPETPHPVSPPSDTPTPLSPLQLPIYQGPISGLGNEKGRYPELDSGSGCGGMQSEEHGNAGPALSMPGNEKKSEGRDL